eukprot:scaffold39081_cov28-Attheya_sp.AAC.1
MSDQRSVRGVKRGLKGRVAGCWNGCGAHCDGLGIGGRLCAFIRATWVPWPWGLYKMREAREDEEMVARVSFLICWNSSATSMIVGDHGGLIDQGVHLREQCVSDPRGAVFDLIKPGSEGSGAS